MKRLMLLCLLMFPVIISAQDDVPYDLTVDTEQFPTYALVAETIVPELDRVEIAYRLRGIDADVTVLSATPVRNVGDQQTFRISRLGGNGYTDATMTLRVISDHLYLWIENDIVVNQSTLQTLTARFDQEVYQFVRDLWGEEASPGIDSETRLHLVISSQLTAGFAGYYSPSNTLPLAIAPNSNQLDMLILDDYVLLPENVDSGVSTAAHEFFHMVHDNLDTGESSWLNEGVATLTEHLLGLEDAWFFVEAFARAPQTSLTLWGTGGEFTPEYGSAMLFMIYLYDRFGVDFVREVVTSTERDLQSIDTVLMRYNAPSVDEVFADWVVANALTDNNTIYGYQSLNFPLEMNITNLIPAQTYTASGSVQAYGTDYYRFFDVPDRATVQFSTGDTLSLLPVSPVGGEMMWYSGRRDLSNPRLTRAFDLRDVSEASLTFDIWYDLERDWDYAYVSVSTDGGEQWQPQTMRWTTDSNINGTAYGAGFTGRNSGWRTDRLDLTPFTGQEIMVRFEVVTDDAINYNGVALDNVRLDAVGYSHDAEQDDGGWQSEGWIRTDNRLPQRSWVQIVEATDGDPIVHRFLSTGDESWTIDFSDNTQVATIAISPIAPMTLQPVRYTLQVD